MRICQCLICYQKRQTLKDSSNLKKVTRSINLLKVLNASSLEIFWSDAKNFTVKQAHNLINDRVIGKSLIFITNDKRFFSNTHTLKYNVEDLLFKNLKRH